MPASILQGLFEVILEALLEVFCCFVGQIVVPIASLGRLKCDKFASGITRRKFRWHGLFHRRGRQVYLTAEATAVVGFFIIITAIAIGFLIYYFAS